MTVRTALRPLRAAAFTTVCVAVTAVGHAVEAGRPVRPLALCVALPVVFAAALGAGARERSATAIFGGMLSSQIVVHLLFTELDPDPAGTATMGGHPATTCPGAGMLALHLGLAVLTAWWLRRGEVACFRLLRRVESGTVAARRRARAAGRGVAGASPCAPGPPALPMTC